MKHKLWDKLEITWEDSVAMTGWRGSEEFNDEHELIHFTCGYFLKEYKHSIAIAQSYGKYVYKDGTQNVTEVIQIPKKAILEIKQLK